MPLDHYLTLGRSGLRVSPFTLGTMTFGDPEGWGADATTSAAMLTEYLERGGNSIDTANVYTAGNSERIIGDYLADRPGLRDRLVLGTKFFASLRPGDPNAGGAGRKAMIAALEDSLRRLRTDYVDIYWLHNWDRATPIEETLRALDDLVTSGKIRYVGVSDLPAFKAAEASLVAQFRGWAPVIAMQVEYSLLARTPEGELLPMAQERGIGVLPWGPLRGSLLSGKWSRGAAAETTRSWVRPTESDYAVIDVLDEVAAESGHTPAAVALSWVQNRPAITSTLIGARRLDQLRTNLDAVDVALTADQTARLDAVSTPTLNFPADNNRTLAPDLAFAGATVDGTATKVAPALAARLNR
ncbi:aldo/keto reductase [Paractinoplanes globisporus]|uniref:Aldo/keto reductase n=1 Tax=Paractinoplanes globisporus TaxID=113565 RepID=A0ABW6WE53_9ACTN|nr:aldo/keto reductase [Actinoplanes globisporus]